MAVYNLIFGSTADTYGSGLGTVYSTVRASTGVTAGNETLTSGIVANSFSTPNYSCTQSFFVFDTSAVSAGTGTGFFSINATGTVFNTNADTVRVREVSTVANKIAGASLSGLTLHSNPGTFPTAAGRYTCDVLDVSAIPRSATFRVVMHTVGEENGTVPTGQNQFSLNFADQTGTTSDPFLQLYLGSPWEFVGVSNVVEVTATAHALVTTGISGTLQAGDLLVACITSRIASTTSVTLPTGWSLVSEQKNNNTLATTSAAASGLMAYCVRGASDPSLTFTHPVAPSVAIGRIVAYRNVNQSSPKDTQTSFTTASTTAVSGTGLTTTQIEDLIVAMAAGGQEAAWSAFNATDPVGASGATSTVAPTTRWLERADSLTTTGADTSLAIFDAVKLTSGATGNLTATADMAALHVVIAGAFKIAVSAPPPVTGTGTPAAQASASSGLGVSSSDGTGALAAQAATAAGAGVSASSGAGALAAQAATVSGAGAVASTGTGVLTAQAAAVVGAGASASTGTGSLVAGAADLAGTGTAVAANSGALVAQAATVAGLGVSGSTGSGALQAGAAIVAGAGLVASAGTGDLVAGPATVAGAGEVIAAGAAVGTGALVAGAAALSGEGEVTGEVAPPISAAIGGHWRPVPPRPEPVEGVGYAILPQLEGEAHGVVLATGAGAAPAPRISGVGTGAAGVDGRSAARLSIKAAGIGERGLAGLGAGTIVGIKAAAIGRHDDDEAAAVLAFLLAA